jgi:hypothetical protein
MRRQAYGLFLADFFATGLNAKASWSQKPRSLSDFKLQVRAVTAEVGTESIF